MCLEKEIHIMTQERCTKYELTHQCGQNAAADNEQIQILKEKKKVEESCDGELRQQVTHSGC